MFEVKVIVWWFLNLCKIVRLFVKGIGYLINLVVMFGSNFKCCFVFIMILVFCKVVRFVVDSFFGLFLFKFIMVN